MATFYKSHGREMTVSDDKALADKLKADGWSLEKPEAEEVVEETVEDEESVETDSDEESQTNDDA